MMNRLLIAIVVLAWSLDVHAQKPADSRSLRRLSAAIETQKKVGERLQERISQHEKRIESLNKQLAEAKAETENLRTASCASLSSFRLENEKIIDQFEKIESSAGQRTLSLLIFCAAIALSGTVGFLYLLKRINAVPRDERLDAKVPTTPDLHNLHEQNGRDAEFLEVLTDTYSLLQERTFADGNSEATVDHRLPLKVGDEIHRMRKRIENMPQEIKGLGALRNSLRRLEEEFNESGYQIDELLGKQYDDGMRLDARFVDDPSVPKGVEVITEVLRPQIKYRDKVIQFARVEVGKSY